MKFSVTQSFYCDVMLLLLLLLVKIGYGIYKEEIVQEVSNLNSGFFWCSSSVQNDVCESTVL